MATRNNGKPEDNTGTPGSNPAPETQAQATSNSAYLNAALRVSTSYPLGASRLKEGVDTTTHVTSTYAVPGIFVYDYVPMLGISHNGSSALNRAAYIDFNAVRSQISGNRPYEPADMQIYRAAVDSLRDLYIYLVRAYYVAQSYSALNLYKPKALLSAMGLNAQDYIDNVSRLYNGLMQRSNSLLPFPTVKIGTITDRHNKFNTVFYTDGDISRSQTYIINQKAFWSYEVVDEVKGLTARKLPSTVAGALALFDAMYNALQFSSDVYLIASDIRRAYGDSVVTTLTPPEIKGEVECVKMDTVLTSIMNMSMLPRDTLGISSQYSDDNFYAAFRIFDEDSTLKCEPTFSGSISIYDVTELEGTAFFPSSFNHLNMIDDEPSTEAISDAMRMHADIVTSLQQQDDNTLAFNYTVKSVGTEICVGCRYVTTSGNNDTFVNRECAGSIYYGLSNSYTYTVEAALRTLADVANFDWHHPFMVSAGVGSTFFGTDKSAYMCEDIQNYVPINSEFTENVHNAQLLNEFGVGI